MHAVRRVLLLTLGVVASPGASALGFDALVDCRIAVERVLHEQRVWPAANPDPKPAFDALVTRADIERRVALELARAAALDRRGRSFDAGVLAAELARMASATRDPELLEKLFDAAGDGERAALCIALPGLVSRADDPAPAPAAAGGIAPVDIDARGVALPAIEPKLARAVDDKEESPDARYGHAAAWTGVEMVVFGGSNNDVRFGNGGRYVPATDSWITLPASGAPSARFLASAVWTGLDVIVYGGTSSQVGTDALGTGARYRPTSDSWLPVATTGAPIGRYDHVAVWTGTSMIVFSGVDATINASSDGGIYTPSTDAWGTLPPPPAGNARFRAVGVWTGSEMVVWSGNFSTFFRNDGLRYTPGGSWSTMSTTNAPQGRGRATGVWFGPPVSRLVAWGGQRDTGALGTGGLWDPAGNTWAPMSSTGAPSARFLHTAVSTGSEMLVWGGTTNLTDGLGDGARFSPAANAWLGPIPAAGSPSARSLHTAVWTGDEMIVWGGRANGLPFLTGGRHAPATGAWNPTWRAVGCDDFPGNLVPGCGFEQAGWGGLFVVENVFRGGAKSGTGSSVPGSIAHSFTAFGPCFTAIENRSYLFGAALRGNAPLPAGCSVALLAGSAVDCSNATPRSGSTSFAVPLHGWRLFEAVGTTQAGDAGAQLQIRCAGQDPFTIHVDDAFAMVASDALFADGFE